MIIHDRQSGFTLVETLVAITILMIAIAGPLSIASKSLTAAMTARDQLVASYLAQESMEVIKNARDNNFRQGFAFLAGFPNGCPQTPATQNCDASAVDNPRIAGAPAAPLKLNSAGYYSHGFSGTNTRFSRRFYLTQVNPDEYQATVIVSWVAGVIPYEVRLVSTITSNMR